MLLGLSQEKLGRGSRPHLPAGPEIREGHEQDRREPASANRAIPQDRNRVFFGGLSEEKQQGGFAEDGTAYVIDFLNSSEGLQLNSIRPDQGSTREAPI